MARQLPPIKPVHPYQDRQLDTSDSYSCDVPQSIQQAQLMKITYPDGTPVPNPAVTTLLANATENKAVK